jgi:NADPH:quinone reductase
MRASRLHHIGGSLQLDNVDAPIASDGEVLVEMAYASVNPLDVWVTQGNVGVAGANLPWTPGTEGTGYVDGRPVLVRGGGIGVARPGLTAELVAVPAGCVTELPDDRHLAEIAALGVAGVTAWNAVHVHGKITAADRVVVLGASGGVGSLAVQMAVSCGATVWGQSSNAGKVDGILADGWLRPLAISRRR